MLSLSITYIHQERPMRKACSGPAQLCHTSLFLRMNQEMLVSMMRVELFLQLFF